MFNVGGGEMVAIFLLALIVLGPERLPKAMGQVGRAVGQLRRMSGGFQDEIRRAMDPDDAPFRPGEEVLHGPPPGIEDEVRVVGGASDAAVDAGPDGAEPPDLVPGDVPDEAPDPVPGPVDELPALPPDELPDLPSGGVPGVEDGLPAPPADQR